MEQTGLFLKSNLFFNSSGGHLNSISSFGIESIIFLEKGFISTLCSYKIISFSTGTSRHLPNFLKK